MSLWRHRRAIARAAVGELDPAVETRLRQHLGVCAACRAHYDACRTIAALGGIGKQAAAQERARLLRAIQPPGAAPADARAPTPARGQRRWVWALVPAVAGAAAMALVLVRRPPSTLEAPPPGEPEVAMRGPAPGPTAAGDGAPAPALALRFYGRARAPQGGPPAPVRLVGVLPGSGELRAGPDEELQIAYVGLAQPQHLALLALDERGTVHRLYPPPGSDDRPAALPPAREPRLLGARIGLTGTAGRLRLSALVTSDPQALARFERALREHAADPAHKPPAATFGGTLWIDR